MIEDYINDKLSGDMGKNALELVTYLRTSGMLFERGKGYWEDKLYWLVTYKDKYVCFILICTEDGKMESWTVWSDDSGSNCFENARLDEHMKRIAWENVDTCANCGGCGNRGRTCKTIFGKEFDNVCITAMRFDTPDETTVECMKELARIRKNDIEGASI